MGVAIDIARTEDKAAPELEGIVSHAVLSMACGACPLPGGRVGAAEKMEQGSVLQARGAIGFAVLVDQERECDACLLAEETGVVAVSEPDGGQMRPLRQEYLLVFAQLRDVLTTEDSAVVAEKDEDCGAVGPQRPESDLLAFAVRQDDAREPGAEGFFHGAPFWAGPRRN